MDHRSERPTSTRPLKIGLVAPPWVTVPPPAYGGTELVVDLLARGLARAGHDVTLFTTGDSTCPVRRRWLHSRALGTEADLAEEIPHVRAAYEALADVDVIHDHTLSGPLSVEPPPGTPPIVTTVHGELVDSVRPGYARASERMHVVAISHSQRRSAPEVRFSAVIHHGIDVATVPLGRADGGYVLFLGRMSPNKGAHRAIQAARLAGRKIVIAAKMWEAEERRYYHEMVEPLLGPDAVYVGNVGGIRKQELIGGAEALLNPIRWPEPFGLVMIEALACGTPVLAFPEGAAPEIVDHGRNGFLCGDERDMAEKLDRVHTIDRAACRADAEARFSVERMVADHLTLYRRAIATPRPITSQSGPLAPSGSTRDRGSGSTEQPTVAAP